VCWAWIETKFSATLDRIHEVARRVRAWIETHWMFDCCRREEVPAVCGRGLNESSGIVFATEAVSPAVCGRGLKPVLVFGPKSVPCPSPACAAMGLKLLNGKTEMHGLKESPAVCGVD